MPGRLDIKVQDRHHDLQTGVVDQIVESAACLAGNGGDGGVNGCWTRYVEGQQRHVGVMSKLGHLGNRARCGEDVNIMVALQLESEGVAYAALTAAGDEGKFHGVGGGRGCDAAVELS